MTSEQIETSAGVIQPRPLVAYFVVAFALSWLARPVPFSLHYLASYGPAVAGLLVTGITAGKRGLSELLGRALKWRVGWRWILISTPSPAALFVLGLAIARIATGDWPDVSDLGQVNYLPYLGIGALPFWLLTYGLGEEIGWRGTRCLGCSEHARPPQPPSSWGCSGRFGMSPPSSTSIPTSSWGW